jgi:hypothetical protein
MGQLHVQGLRSGRVECQLHPNLFGIIFTTLNIKSGQWDFLIIYIRNVKSLIIVIQNDAGSNLSGIIIKLFDM